MLDWVWNTENGFLVGWNGAWNGAAVITRALGLTVRPVKGVGVTKLDTEIFGIVRGLPVAVNVKGVGVTKLGPESLGLFLGFPIAVNVNGDGVTKLGLGLPVAVNVRGVGVTKLILGLSGVMVKDVGGKLSRLASPDFGKTTSFCEKRTGLGLEDSISETNLIRRLLTASGASVTA